MKSFIILIILLVFSENCYSLDIMSGAVGYAVGKSGNSQTVMPGSPVMDVLPIKCYLGDDGKCGIGNDKIDIITICQQISKEHNAVGFIVTNPESLTIIILCGLAK